MTFDKRTIETIENYIKNNNYENLKILEDSYKNQDKKIWKKTILYILLYASENSNFNQITKYFIDLDNENIKIKDNLYSIILFIKASSINNIHFLLELKKRNINVNWKDAKYGNILDIYYHGWKMKYTYYLTNEQNFYEINHLYTFIKNSTEINEIYFLRNLFQFFYNDINYEIKDLNNLTLLEYSIEKRKYINVMLIFKYYTLLKNNILNLLFISKRRVKLSDNSLMKLINNTVKISYCNYYNLMNNVFSYFDDYDIYNRNINQNIPDNNIVEYNEVKEQELLNLHKSQINISLIQNLTCKDVTLKLFNLLLNYTNNIYSHYYFNEIVKYFAKENNDTYIKIILNRYGKKKGLNALLKYIYVYPQQITNLFLKYEEEINSPFNNSKTIFILLCSNVNSSTYHPLLNLLSYPSLNVHYRDNNGKAGYHYLSISEASLTKIQIFNLLKILINKERGADPYIPISYKCNERILDKIIVFLANYPLEISEILIYLNNPNYKDINGSIPLFYLCQHLNNLSLKAILLLIKNGANYNEPFNKEETILEFLLNNFDLYPTDILNILIWTGNIEKKDYMGKTPLIHLLENPNEEKLNLVIYLIKKHNIKLETEPYRKLLIKLCQKRSQYLKEKINILIALKQVNLEIESGKTMLMLLCYSINKTNLFYIKLLIKNGANVNCKDNSGLTPLDYLSKKNIIINEIYPYL
ncbi:hypothetical protein BCR32DRAFT_270258 [Anaeromyces robustus]|uniref:Uncharacterized protein n=1 Tax=Anaeromyces robustus TaxID=1754192 RepID=A0A1Y1WY13_9FUNG|nr:hypothetical protein BCR32DRAFT_270258 [Anaeromyces robustus]|eukprot:ORX78096.1 hypothetical protein BCR32DRAFT_270258 [Anaeromyces robustus]